MHAGHMNTFKTRWRWWPALALSGGLIGFFGLVVYLGVIRSQGDESVAEIAPWATAIGIASAFAMAAPLVRAARWPRALLLVATVVLGGIGMISGLMPILVPAAILTGLAAYGASPALTAEDAHS